MSLYRDYVMAGLRVEERPNPLVARKVRLKREQAMAAHGVQSRWIGIVDDTGSPYARSGYLPRRPGSTIEDERCLHAQVKAIHSFGIPAMTWFPGSFCLSAFHSRLQRAYGATHAETWQGLHYLYCKHETRPEQFEPLNPYLHHAMACMTAGAMPSFGTPDPGDKPVEAYEALGRLINPLRPFVGGESIPYAGLHLSQQSETFYFSRNVKGGFPWTYWKSVLGWHNLLCESQFLLDVVFDGHLTSDQLGRYPVVVAPLSVALSDQQIRLFEVFVSNGGILVTGPCFGACDEWGSRANSGRILRLTGRKADAPPAINGYRNCDPSVQVHSLGRGHVIRLAGDAGGRFYENHSSLLARALGRLIRRHAPPAVEVTGPLRLHVGMYRDQGRLRLFLHNFIAYSENQRFPNPRYLVPEPARNVTVRLSGYQIRSARSILSTGAPPLEMRRKGSIVEFSIPLIERGEVIEMEI